MAIEVADTMAKAAEVSIVCFHKVDGQNVCVVCKGDVASCQAAVDAGAGLAQEAGRLLGRNVIPSPADGEISVQELLAEINTKKAARKAAKLARRMGTPAPAAPSPQASQHNADNNDSKKPKK